MTQQNQITVDRLWAIIGQQHVELTMAREQIARLTKANGLLVQAQQTKREGNGQPVEALAGIDEGD